MGTGVGISADMSTGVIDRFRTLPIWRAAVLIGRSFSDLLAAALCVTIVAVTGLAIGWRPERSISIRRRRLRGRSLLQLCAVAGCAHASGLVSKGPESAQGVGLIVLFPIAIVSNAMVPTQGMPGWLRTIADWNPVSAVTCRMPRNLFGNPNPSATIHVMADAAPGVGRPRVVGHTAVLRASGGASVQAQDHRIAPEPPNNQPRRTASAGSIAGSRRRRRVRI